MIFLETGIEGVWFIEPERFDDERGFFARTWDAADFAARGLNGRARPVQHLVQPTRGTLRGLHYQAPPHEEAKLVRCTAGAIFDVAVDLRRGRRRSSAGSGSSCRAENRLALYIPEGCAHGFLTLSDDAEVSYQISEFYAPEAARGCSLGRPRVRDCLARRGRRDQRTRPRYPDFEDLAR